MFIKCMYDIDDGKCEHYNGKAMETGSLFMMEGPMKGKKSMLSLELHAFT